MINPSFRNATAKELAVALQDARHYTLVLFDRFSAAGLDVPEQVPYLPIINPPLWELGHIAWFAEWFVLREAESSDPASAKYPSLLMQGDDWFNSNTVPHRARWLIDLPSIGALKTYCHEVLDRVLDKLEKSDASGRDLTPYRLALAHEDMHGEAFVMALQTLGAEAPPRINQTTATAAPQSAIDFPGGTVWIGSAPETGFVFDNEKWAHPVEVRPFNMDAVLVSNAQYSDFIADGGYQKADFWSAAGQAWLMQQERSAPRYWQRDGHQWCTERFGRMTALPAHQAVRHVSLFEAQAYCRWAGRRLPNESEWEYAAMSGQPEFQWGSLWEWTCTPFAPYPGFVADAYREYSAPWFGTHQTLRGASFATRPRMRSPKFRNFYLPQRDDVFVGFRTCAA